MCVVLELPRWRQIGLIKSLLQKIMNEKIEHQVLFFNGHMLENISRLDSCGIREGSSLCLILDSLPIEIVVLHPHGGAAAVMTVQSYSTVKFLLGELQAKFGLVPNEMGLFFNGNELADGRYTLGFYGVSSKSVLRCLQCARTLSLKWTENNFLLSQVASYLQLSDAVKILSLLHHCQSQYLVGDVAIAPSAQLVSKMIGLAAEKEIKINAKTLLWKNLGQGAANHSQMVTLPELRMLHHLLKAIPGDLLLVWGSSVLNQVGEQYNAMGSCAEMNVKPGPGKPATCTLSAQIPDLGLAVELKVNGKRCIQEDCNCAILRSCPACEEVCCACVRGGHAKHCTCCNKHVCPDCIVPDIANANADQSLCTGCGFQCTICNNSRLKSAFEYICAAGKNCTTVNSLCRICVFDNGALETQDCESCNKDWCTGCVEFPECSFCDDTYCSECSAMTQCSRCNNLAHGEDCASDNGHGCKFCGVYCCDTCEQGKFCTNDDCCLSICAACTGEFAVVCPAGHLTCNDCLDSVVGQCLGLEAKWGGVIHDKSCWTCWEEAYAHLKGFDNVDNFNESTRESKRFNVAFKCYPLLQKHVQFWKLGGNDDDDTDIEEDEVEYEDPGDEKEVVEKFDTCAFVKTKLASMTKYDNMMTAMQPTDPLLEFCCNKDMVEAVFRVIDKLVASMAVTHIFVWSTANHVNGISCVNMNSSTEVPVKMPVGREDNSTRSTLTLDEGEHIVSVHVHHDDAIDSLRLVTSAGRDVTFGSEPGAGETTNYRVPAGWRLAGFFGGVGRHLKSLGVVIAENPPA